ncbi:alpha/beta fold hydrolase [Candidatus Thorarchaeota archaeon]|nr:MAG: alpha/beta fold hydrolase [Candidatus Thorarchaeota archaeon]
MPGVMTISTEFSSGDRILKGSFVIPDGIGPFPGICKFHGLPGGPDQVSGIATMLAQAGFMVLTFDFTGFRKSEGIFRLARSIEDAGEAVSHLLESDLSLGSWMGVYGASYGGAIGVCAAARDPRISALCLRAPVYDTLWFAQSSMIRPAVDNIVENDPSQIRGIEDSETQELILNNLVEDAKIHNPMNEISKISPRPLFIIHGSDDEGIDLAGVKRLFEAAGAPKNLVVVEGANHVLSDPTAYEITMKSIVDWFSNTFKRR